MHYRVALLTFAWAVATTGSLTPNSATAEESKSRQRLSGRANPKPTSAERKNRKLEKFKNYIEEFANNKLKLNSIITVQSRILALLANESYRTFLQQAGEDAPLELFAQDPLLGMKLNLREDPLTPEQLDVEYLRTENLKASLSTHEDRAEIYLELKPQFKALRDSLGAPLHGDFRSTLKWLRPDALKILARRLTQNFTQIAGLLKQDPTGRNATQQLAQLFALNTLAKITSDAITDKVEFHKLGDRLIAGGLCSFVTATWGMGFMCMGMMTENLETLGLVSVIPIVLSLPNWSRAPSEKALIEESCSAVLLSRSKHPTQSPPTVGSKSVRKQIR